MLASRNPYPGDYSPTFAFSDLLYPHPRQLPLRLACPFVGRGYGLTVFHLSNTGGLGPASSPAVVMSVCIYREKKHLTAYLLVRACQHLGLVINHGVYQQFTLVDLATQPSAYPH